MAKKKKITEKLKSFYRGPIRKPCKIADEHDMRIISEGLKSPSPPEEGKQCSGSRNYAFKTKWEGSEVKLKIIFGLSSSLRCLRQKRTRAIIYDDTAAPHLAKYLLEFAFKSSLPIMQVHNLIKLICDSKQQSLLVVSLVDVATGDEKIYQAGDKPKPKPLTDTLESKEFDQLCQLLQKVSSFSKQDGTFQLPLINKVPTTGKSKEKKVAKKETKKDAVKKQQIHVLAAS